MVPTTGVATGGTSALGNATYGEVLKNMSLLMSDMSVLGSQMKNNISNGYDINTSTSNAFFHATLSHLTESIGGESIANILTGKIGTKLLSDTAGYAIKALTNQFLAEATEEGVEAAIEPIIGNLTLNKKMTVEQYLNQVFSSDTMYQMLIGGLGGLAMGAGATASVTIDFNTKVNNLYLTIQDINTKEQYNAAKNISNYLENIINEASDDDPLLIDTMALNKAYKKKMAEFKIKNPHADAILTNDKNIDLSTGEEAVVNASRPTLANAFENIINAKEEVIKDFINNVDLTSFNGKQADDENNLLIKDKNSSDYYSYDNLTKISPKEIKTYTPSTSTNQTELRKAIWTNLNEDKTLTNNVTKDSYVVNSTSITNSKLYSPGGYTALENISEIFNDAIPINRTENVNKNNSKRLGNKYTIFYNEFSDGTNIYLTRIVTEHENPNNVNFKPNLHKVKSIDIEKVNNKKRLETNQAGSTSRSHPTSTFSIEQLFYDINSVEDWRNDLSDDVFKKINNGEEKAYKGKDLDYKKLAEVVDQEDTIENKIYNSMSMNEARRMLEKAWNRLKEYVDYSTLDEYLKEEPGIAYGELALQIENNEDLTDEYINSNDDILNEEYTINDVIDAYKNGKLKKDSKSFEIKPIDFGQGIKQQEKLYTPKTIDNPVEIYEIANQRINNNNRDEVLKARGDIIVYSHSPNALETLGLTKAELNKKNT